MKKIFYIFLITQLPTCFCYSQSGWFIQNYLPNEPLYAVYFINTDIGFAGGAGVFYITTNSGVNWIPKSFGYLYAYVDFYFINNLTGFTIGNNNNITNILKTTDAGNTWTLKYSNSGIVSYNTIFFESNNTGYAAGSYVNIVKTTNSGENWFNIYSQQTGTINSIFFTGNGIGYAAGGEWVGVNIVSRIWKTTNGGINWLILANSPNLGMYYKTIFFIDNNTGFAGGVDRVIKTTDGGNHWGLYGSPVSYVNSIVFVNQNTGYASGNIYIYKTTNCGNNWIQQERLDSLSLSDIFFVNENTGYTVGSNCSILKTTTGGEPIGIQPIVTEIPKQFALFQNYPNPFNPVTKIKFSIPSVGAQFIEPVQLWIYDILGREIEVLINEQLSPGTYEVQWDASAFASGVYFYQLSINNERFATKKMVLLK